MAKIHVRGGSPLRLKFEKDDGNALEVHLEAKGGTDEYFVIDTATNKRLLAFGPFTVTPGPQSCEVDYKARAPVEAS